MTSVNVVTEKQLMQEVTRLARRAGWKIYHTWRSDNSPAGFPDLVMVKGERLIFAELKRELGRPTPEQSEWLKALSLVPGVEVYIFCPQDREEYEEVLSR